MSVDRKRRFVLPGIQDLNRDQDRALALPLKGQHLIIGGPGTGKSVVVLLRARRLARNKKEYRTLVFNHLLDHSNRHLFGDDQMLSAKTWMSWFVDIFKHFYGETPRLPPANGSDFRPIDWERVEALLHDIPPKEALGERYLVIDEGQDMPPAFYRALVNLGFENFYVAADQNQQIHPEQCSARQDIETELGLKAGATLELKTNYRNTRPIARLAQSFYPDDPASPRPDLPAARTSALTPELWIYDVEGKPTLGDIADRILQLSDRQPRKLIGVITPNNVVRTNFLNALRTASPRLDNDRPPIQTFESGQKQQLDFGEGGVMVINAQSCKGLEFDVAILADIDEHQPKWDLHVLKARFYVMTARAREQLILLRRGTPCPVIEDLLPADDTLLVRK